MDHHPPADAQHPPLPEDDAWPTLLVLPFLVGQVAFLSVWVVSQLIYLISSACYKNPNEDPRFAAFFPYSGPGALIIPLVTGCQSSSCPSG